MESYSCKFTCFFMLLKRGMPFPRMIGWIERIISSIKPAFSSIDTISPPPKSQISFFLTDYCWIKCLAKRGMSSSIYSTSCVSLSFFFPSVLRAKTYTFFPCTDIHQMSRIDHRFFFQHG